MARIDFEDDNLVITIEGWHKLFALKHKILVRLASVKGARKSSELPQFTDGDFRGTYLPGKLVAGLALRSDDGVVFCDVSDPTRAIVIDLEGAEYKHIVVEVSNLTPDAAASRINDARAAIHQHSAGAEAAP